MLKECVVLMLEDKNRTATSIRCTNRNAKSSRCVKRTVLLTLNTFLKCCAENSFGYVLNIEVSKS